LKLWLQLGLALGAAITCPNASSQNQSSGKPSPAQLPEAAQESPAAGLARNIISLEFREEVTQGNQSRPTVVRRPVGTAFLVSTPEALYLVTASHVVAREQDLYAMVPTLDPSRKLHQLLELHLPKDRWVRHPALETPTHYGVDIAVMKIPQPKRHIAAMSYCVQDCPPGFLNQFALTDPELALPVIILGFPLGLGMSLKEPAPMVRLGIIALQPEEEVFKYGNKYADSKTFFVDAKIFKGNSGSPIFEFPALRQGNLVGIVIGMNHILDLAIAEPVSRIRETIDQAKDQPVDFEPWSSAAPDP
jgi:S1-C subfamily serine protease